MWQFHHYLCGYLWSEQCGSFTIFVTTTTTTTTADDRAMMNTGNGACSPGACLAGVPQRPRDPHDPETPAWLLTTTGPQSTRLRMMTTTGSQNTPFRTTTTTGPQNTRFRTTTTWLRGHALRVTCPDLRGAKGTATDVTTKSMISTTWLQNAQAGSACTDNRQQRWRGHALRITCPDIRGAKAGTAKDGTRISMISPD